GELAGSGGGAVGEDGDRSAADDQAARADVVHGERAGVELGKRGGGGLEVGCGERAARRDGHFGVLVQNERRGDEVASAGDGDAAVIGIDGTGDDVDGDRVAACERVGVGAVEGELADCHGNVDGDGARRGDAGGEE